MSHCVFRCIENRVSAVRATNTGATCFIDGTGRIYHGEFSASGQPALRPGPAQLYAEVFSVATVSVPKADAPPTFYSRFGDLPLGAPATAMVMACFFLAALERKRKDSSPV